MDDQSKLASKIKDYIGRHLNIESSLDDYKDIDYLSGERSQTLLMFAAENENIEMIRLLLDRGANPNIQNSDGKTALMFAVMNDSPQRKIIQLLLDRGADPDIADNEGKIVDDYEYVSQKVKITLSQYREEKLKEKDNQTELQITQPQDNILNIVGNNEKNTIIEETEEINFQPKLDKVAQAATDLYKSLSILKDKGSFRLAVKQLLTAHNLIDLKKFDQKLSNTQLFDTHCEQTYKRIQDYRNEKQDKRDNSVVQKIIGAITDFFEKIGLIEPKEKTIVKNAVVAAIGSKDDLQKHVDKVKGDFEKAVKKTKENSSPIHTRRSGGIALP